MRCCAESIAISPPSSAMNDVGQIHKNAHPAAVKLRSLPFSQGTTQYKANGDPGGW